MFLGTFEPKLDDKGRVALPARFREEMQGGIVVTKGQERCLVAYPAEDFKRLVAEYSQAPATQKRARNYLRVLLASATQEIPDKQGRIVIPQELRRYAGLGKELAVIGTGSRVEIWDSDAWRDFLEAEEEVFADTEEEIIPGLF